MNSNREAPRPSLGNRMAAASPLRQPIHSIRDGLLGRSGWWSCRRPEGIGPSFERTAASAPLHAGISSTLGAGIKVGPSDKPPPLTGPGLRRNTHSSSHHGWIHSVWVRDVRTPGTFLMPRTIIHRTVHNPNGQMPFGQKFGRRFSSDRVGRSVGRFSPPRTWRRSGCRTGRPEDERSLSWLRWGGEGLALLVVWVSADRSVRYQPVMLLTVLFFALAGLACEKIKSTS